MNRYGVITCSNISIQRDANHKSETISEVLWGEPFKIINQEQEWSYIELLYDHYKGWIPSINIKEIEKEKAEYIDQTWIPIATFSHHHTLERKEEEELIHLPLGAMIESSPRKMSSIQRIVEHLLGVSYHWGGRSSFGIDCSGFTQLLFKFLRLRLPRDAKDQAKLGENIPWGEQKFGDLAFFGKDEQNITHVGFIEDNQTIVHASGQVKRDTYNSQGITNNLKTLTHKLLFIKRIKQV